MKRWIAVMFLSASAFAASVNDPPVELLQNLEFFKEFDMHCDSAMDDAAGWAGAASEVVEASGTVPSSGTWSR